MTTRFVNPSCPTAQSEACKNATEPRPKTEPVPGVLYDNPAGVENGRLWPSDALSAFVEHFWWVRWRVTEPRSADVLSYPSVHVVFEGEGARIVGIVRRMFSRRIEGEGSVFSVKFWPGMFRPLHGAPAWHLTDKEVPLAGELGRDAVELAFELARQPTDLERAKLLELALLAALPAPNPDAVLARDLVSRVRQEVTILSVSALASESGLTVRGLQRLFRDYVGVSPKWVVRRFRLQEAAERLRSGGDTVASVAADLGYFDQAHFVRDFKAVVGRTPTDYVSQARERRTEGVAGR